MPTEEKSKNNPIKEELRLILGEDAIDETFQPRDGLEISMFSLSPSEENLKGTTGYRIKHLPLTPQEADLLNLEPRSDGSSHRVTLMVLSMHYDKKFMKDILDGNPQAPRYYSKNYFGGLSDSVLGTQISYPESNAQVEYFQEAVEKQPDKEILVLFGHFLTTDRFQPTGKLVGSPHEFDWNSEYLEEILKAEDLEQYSAVLDGTCNEDQLIPEFPPSPTPYFGALSLMGGFKTTGAGMIIHNGNVEKFNEDAKPGKI